MSQGLVERQNLEDIADAIRSKNGSSDTYTPAEMAQAISGIHTADEVVLVQKTVNANGQYNASDDSADGYSGVRVNVPNTYSASDEGKVVSNGDLVAQTTKQITANGTHDTTTNNSVSVDVPNSYAAADEGKVVSGGALVGQTSRNVTINGTYDTTTNNEVIVNVSGGGGGGEYSLSLAEYLQFYGTSPGQIIGLPYTVSSDYEIDVDFEVTETSSNNSVIGNSNKYDKPHLTIYNNKWYTSTGGNDLNFGNSSMLTGRHTVVINKNGNSVLFDEQVVLSNLSNNSYQDVYLWVGGRYSSSPGYTLAKAKIYEYKITSISTGNVICDLKPAEIKKNNNVVIIGLYDVINDVFYTSSGTNVGGTLIQKTITQNGTYNASYDNADGYSQVVVDVSGGGAQTIPNIYISSNLQISNGWIKGFSSGSNYFQPLNSQDTVLDVDWSKSFEIGVSFKYEQTINRSMVLFGSVNGFCYAPSIEISSNSAGIWCGYTTNGSSWDNSIDFSSSDGLVLQSDIKYTIKAMYDETNYIVSIDDGTNIISKSIIVSPHYHNSNYKMGFGGIARSSDHCAKHVQMYLPEMYIKQNGVKIWG